MKIAKGMHRKAKASFFSQGFSSERKGLGFRKAKASFFSQGFSSERKGFRKPAGSFFSQGFSSERKGFRKAKASFFSQGFSSERKGFSHTDFIIAVAAFFIVFATVVQLTTSYFAVLRESTEVSRLRSDAFSLLALPEKAFVPYNWSVDSSPSPESIGLGSKAYYFLVMVNNTPQNQLNQSNPEADRASELVNFNLSFPHLRPDLNSVYIKNRANQSVPYSRSGHLYTFATAVNANQSIYFTVYFDDDSNFTDLSSSVSGSNNITESVFAVMPFNIVQYRKVMLLNQTNYTSVKPAADIASDFNIKIFDNATNTTFFEFGGSVPRVGDVVALERWVLYQNATAAVREARLTVQAWSGD